MAELLTDDIIYEALEADGIMQEPDANWLIEYIESEYGGKLDNTSDWCDKKHNLKIYSESTADSYDIYWCTYDERPYVCQDGYQYEDYPAWSEQAIEALNEYEENLINLELPAQQELNSLTEIQRINNQIRFNVLLAGLAIAFSLILFSFFLNFIILKPIKKLAKAAENVDADVKSKPLITVLDRREDEIGQLSKIINTMLKNLYQKIDNAENNSADLMHEIRNPLASIRMATDVINDKLDDEQKKFLDLILNDISRIENIITDYSSMIKDEVNLYKSQSNVFNIRELLDELIHNYKENVSNKLNIKFFANENQNLLVNGQKSFLYQAFDNIIMNAASFSPSGGIIEIVLSSTENYLSVSISDEGPGIKDPNIKRIFDRFYSFRDNKSDQGHSGLGLSIAKQIIDAHDGYISADNVIEGGNIMGAKFIVNLPLAD